MPNTDEFFETRTNNNQLRVRRSHEGEEKSSCTVSLIEIDACRPRTRHWTFRGRSKARRSSAQLQCCSPRRRTACLTRQIQASVCPTHSWHLFRLSCSLQLFRRRRLPPPHCSFGQYRRRVLGRWPRPDE